MEKDPLTQFNQQRITNHKALFTGDTGKTSQLLKLASSISFIVGVILIIFSLHMEMGLMIFFLMSIPFVVSIRADKVNLKGVPLDPRVDLVQLVTYSIDEILGENLCAISVVNPGAGAFSCVAESRLIEQMANRNWFEFNEKLVFMLDEQRHFTFIQGTKRPEGPIDPLEGFEFLRPMMQAVESSKP